MGFGWKNSHGVGKAGDAITSGIEGPWTSNPPKWDNGYFDLLFKYEDSWKLVKSPAGANQWTPENPDEEDMLDLAVDLQPTSRLGCQIEMSELLDGLIVTIPENT